MCCQMCPNRLLVRKGLICNTICQFPWCKHSHHSRVQAAGVKPTSLQTSEDSLALVSQREAAGARWVGSDDVPVGTKLCRLHGDSVGV